MHLPEDSMDTQKAENLLNLAYNTPDFQRTRSLVLDSAVNPNGLWEIIVKGCCDLSFLSQTHPQIRVTSLIQNYAILTLPKELIPYVASLEEVIYVEMPKRLFFSVSQGILASCIRPVSSPPLSLDGTGTLVGIIDSGIDSSHPDFLTADGTSRIRFLWDQSLEGNPPEGYSVGTEYDQEQITAALREGKRVSVDPTGHGTAVAGIAAGNGRASDGQYRGVAPNADLIVVKMRPSLPNSFPRTAELMMGINYCVNQAIRLRMPLALNLSFGNNYGCHTGTSLVETFLDQASFLGQTTIVAGSGNEGASPIHTSGTVIPGRQTVVEFSVGPREPALDLQLWKNYADDFTIRLVTPSQTSVGPFPSTEGPQRWSHSSCLLRQAQTLPVSSGNFSGSDPGFLLSAFRHLADSSGTGFHQEWFLLHVAAGRRCSWFFHPLSHPFAGQHADDPLNRFQRHHGRRLFHSNEAAGRFFRQRFSGSHPQAGPGCSRRQHYRSCFACHLPDLQRHLFFGTVCHRKRCPFDGMGDCERK